MKSYVVIKLKDNQAPTIVYVGNDQQEALQKGREASPNTYMEVWEDGSCVRSQNL